MRKVSEDGRINLINKNISSLKKLLDLYKRTVCLRSQQTPEMVFVFFYQFSPIDFLKSSGMFDLFFNSRTFLGKFQKILDFHENRSMISCELLNKHFKGEDPMSTKVILLE